jgi:hypothetical protein
VFTDLITQNVKFPTLSLLEKIEPANQERWTFNLPRNYVGDWRAAQHTFGAI